MKEILNIVNDNDEIIGKKDRVEIHKEGLLHREIHIFFVTPNREIIFQHRSEDKDTYPDLLDATVVGHLEAGNGYEETAIKEAKEETGIKLDDTDLIFINKVKKFSKDNLTGRINNAFSSRYLYIYRGDITDLQIEAGKSFGFEAWPIDKLLALEEYEKTRFIPSVLKFISTDLIDYLKHINL